MLLSISWVSAPRSDRFPPETLRLTAAGRRLLGSPVRGIERESEEKAEGGWELRREMLSTPKLVVHKSAI